MRLPIALWSCALACVACGGGGGGGAPGSQQGPVDDSVWSGPATLVLRTSQGVADLGGLRCAFVLDGGIVEGVSVLESESGRSVAPIAGSIDGNHIEFTFGDYQFVGNIPSEQSSTSADTIEGTISLNIALVAGPWNVVLKREGANDAPEDLAVAYAGIASSNEGAGEADVTVYFYDENGFAEGEFWVGDAVANYTGAIIDNDFVTGLFEFEETGETGSWTGTVDSLEGISGTYEIFDGPALVDRGSFSITPDPMNAPPGSRRSLVRRNGGKIGRRP